MNDTPYYMKKMSKRGRRIRRRLARAVETVAFYFGAVAWIIFIAHLFVVTALG